MAPNPELPSSGSIADLQGQLATLAQRIQSAARRSRRLSWLSVGYIVAVGVGFALAFFVELLLFLASSGSPASTTTLVSAFCIAVIPPLVVAVFAVREVLLGRREAKEPCPPSRTESSRAPVSGMTGWTETVQQSQQVLTHMRHETEWSFVWFILGSLFLSITVAGFVLLPFVSSLTSLGLYSVVPIYVVAFAFLLLLIPFYLVAREWIGEYQDELDWEVNGLSRLEAEFFTRFATLAVPT